MKTPSQKIDQYVSELHDWRRATFSEIRRIVLEADPDAVEEFKWMGTPVWYHDGIIACCNAHKDKVKITFNQGARLQDPKKLFNASLDGNQRRAIDLYERDKIDKRGLKALILAAVAYNGGAAKKSKPKTSTSSTKPRRTTRRATRA